MKKIKKAMLALTLLLGVTCVGGFAACGKDDGGNISSASEEKATLSLNVTDKDMLYGEILELIPKYTMQAGETMVWSTSNSAVATVNDGSVEAVGEGTAVITVVYGDLTATCNVSVGFGDLQPVLRLANIDGDEIRLGKNSAYSLDTTVAFNNRSYPCDVEVDIEDGSVVEYANGEIKALGTGTTSITVKGVWNGISGALMQKTFSVTVFNDVTMVTKLTLGEEMYVTDTANLYIVPTWGDNSYFTSADLEVAVNESGETKTATVSVIEGSEFIQYEDGHITAVAEGTARLHATYTDSESKQFETFFTINVHCPVVDYTEAVDYCTSESFPVADLFGEGAKITSATQGDVVLTVDGAKLSGVTAQGDNTADVTVHTDKGGYRFTDIFAYDKEITSENFAETFTLKGSREKPIEGYFVLNADATVGALAHEENNCLTAMNFSGTFDGRGHKLSATVGLNGLFGALGNGAVIKNAHVEFTFPETGVACGFAYNKVGWNAKDANNNVVDLYVTFENLYITTTNYTPTAIVLTYFKAVHTVMKDLYINITGIGEYTSVTDEYAALFKYDPSFNNGHSECYNGEFQNVQVVTGKFVPMANGITPWNTATRFVSYAQNDESYLGKITHVNSSISHKLYCFINNDNSVDSAETKLFGTNNYMYAANPSIANGGVSRYNTVSELKNAGIKTVGTWTVQ